MDNMSNPYAGVSGYNAAIADAVRAAAAVIDYMLIRLTHTGRK